MEGGFKLLNDVMWKNFENPKVQDALSKTESSVEEKDKDCDLTKLINTWKDVSSVSPWHSKDQTH